MVSFAIALDLSLWASQLNNVLQFLRPIFYFDGSETIFYYSTSDVQFGYNVIIVLRNDNILASKEK